MATNALRSLRYHIDTVRRIHDAVGSGEFVAAAIPGYSQHEKAALMNKLHIKGLLKKVGMSSDGTIIWKIPQPVIERILDPGVVQV